MAIPTSAYPGQILASSTTHNAGPGTHIHGNNITASLAGKAVVQTTTDSTGSSARKPSKPTISITSASSARTQAQSEAELIPSRHISRHNTLPTVSAIVLARVTRLVARQANVSICVVDGNVCADEFAGVIRREDVRGWEVDRVVVHEAFRVGDVVRAVVISLGDQSSYYLSTARNELGVLLAVSESGNQMYPISWQHFRDPVTGKDEVRKVAKPV